MRGVRVVLADIHDRVAGKRAKIGFERVGERLVIDLIAIHVERERFEIFRFFAGFSMVSRVHRYSG